MMTKIGNMELIESETRGRRIVLTLWSKEREILYEIIGSKDYCYRGFWAWLRKNQNKVFGSGEDGKDTIGITDSIGRSD